MSEPPPRRLLVKIGGSLLDLPNLRDRLLALPTLLGGTCTFVVGGGDAAELARKFQRTHGLDDTAAHDLAVEAMRLTACFVRSLLGDAYDMVWEVWDDDISDLPASWDVTSDSIAAHLARKTERELVLAKSVPPPRSIAVAAARGDVDRYFETAASGLAVHWLNLRTPDPICVRIATGA